MKLQDQNPTLWFSENGQRVGTYVGHNGQISTCDVSSKSHDCVNMQPRAAAPNACKALRILHISHACAVSLLPSPNLSICAVMLLLSEVHALQWTRPVC